MSQTNSTGPPPATADEFDMFAQSRQTTFQDSRKRLVTLVIDPRETFTSPLLIWGCSELYSA